MPIKGFWQTHDTKFNQLKKSEKIVFRRDMTSARREDPLTPKQNKSPRAWNQYSQLKTKRKSKGAHSLGYHILQECSQTVGKNTTEV